VDFRWSRLQSDMPEGHTVHRIARDHHRWFQGQTLHVSSPQGRFRRGAKRLTGRRLARVEAYGKHLLYLFEGDHLLHIHLGMYGKFRMHKLPLTEPRGQVRLRVLGEERGFDLNGPTCCEVIVPEQRDDLLNRLGADPLSDDADVDWLWNRISKSRAAIGSLLMNQAVFAGVGNIYRSEILFTMDIAPDRAARELTQIEFDQLWSTLVKWMKLGVKHNRIITVDVDQANKPAGRLKRNERLQIYKKENCPKCGGDVSRGEIANRAVYFCNTCQS